MKNVYLCGGINGLSDADCVDWRELAKGLLTAGTVDPMRRDYRGVEDSNVDQIVELDLADIDVCSHILVNAERPSWGTAMEIVYAYLRGKKIVAFCSGRVSPWLRYHCAHIFLNVEAGCNWINGDPE